MLAIVALLRRCRLRHQLPFLFIGNVGEEGEGDLRGMRHIFSQRRAGKTRLRTAWCWMARGPTRLWRKRLGSRRFEVIVRGPGGHSWSDFGAPNPIVVLARTVEEFAILRCRRRPRRTFNIGVIRGGTSVNSIPESASMRVDYAVDLDGGDGAPGAIAPREPRSGVEDETASCRSARSFAQAHTVDG